MTNLSALFFLSTLLFLFTLSHSSPSLRPHSRLPSQVIEYRLSDNEVSMLMMSNSGQIRLFVMDADENVERLLQNRPMLETLAVSHCQLQNDSTLVPFETRLQEALSHPVRLICDADKSFTFQTFDQQHAKHKQQIRQLALDKLTGLSIRTTPQQQQGKLSEDSSKFSISSIVNDIIGVFKKHSDDNDNNIEAKQCEYPYESIDLIGATAAGVTAWSYQFVRHHWGKLYPFKTVSVSSTDDTNTQIFDMRTGKALSIADSQTLALSTSVSDESEAIRYSIASDWAAGTREASYVAYQMDDENPHWTLHLGDIYYVGTDDEVKYNFLGVPPEGCLYGVRFPYGILGAVSIMGNHEMYSRAYGYYETLLPTLGVRPTPDSLTLSGQETAFFVHESEDWRIIGLDTGYSTYSIKIQNDNVQLPDELVEWLRNVVRLNNTADTRGLIFLTHHQPISAFENGFKVPAQQLEDLLPANRTVLWLFGHEHRLSFYDRQPVVSGKLQVYARCIGNSGFPTQLSPLPTRAKSSRLLVYDDRVYAMLSGLYSIDVGFNGWLEMHVRGTKVDLTYKSLTIDPVTGKLLNETDSQTISVKETFSVDRKTGNVELEDFKVIDGNLTLVNYGRS